MPKAGSGRRDVSGGGSSFHYLNAQKRAVREYARDQMNLGRTWRQELVHVVSTRGKSLASTPSSDWTQEELDALYGAWGLRRPTPNELKKDSSGAILIKMRVHPERNGGGGGGGRRGSSIGGMGDEGSDDSPASMAPASFDDDETEEWSDDASLLLSLSTVSPRPSPRSSSGGSSGPLGGGPGGLVASSASSITAGHIARLRHSNPLDAVADAAMAAAAAQIASTSLSMSGNRERSCSLPLHLGDLPTSHVAPAAAEEEEEEVVKRHRSNSYHVTGGMGAGGSSMTRPKARAASFASAVACPSFMAPMQQSSLSSSSLGPAAVDPSGFGGRDFMLTEGDLNDEDLDELLRHATAFLVGPMILSPSFPDLMPSPEEVRASEVWKGVGGYEQSAGGEDQVQPMQVDMAHG